ncbi:hypothetical protein [Alcanivorax sp. NBRC 102028]|jgi:hypothetical protein|uniref:hypothetical protein n=1 Tax=Alcanivorax sp. NBRC 102028 TaxID=1113897 RepID=UPI000789F7B8|nr:hypothetical protein [Alcanivorax sp. NBRC 102028]
MKKISMHLAGGLVLVAGLSGCMSANYYTEQGTPITQQTIDHFNTNPNDPIIPYSKGKTSYDAYPWASDKFQESLNAKPKSSANDELAQVADYWLHDGGMPPLDITVTRQPPENSVGTIATVVFSTLGCTFSLCLIPMVAPQQFETTIEMRSEGELVYSANAHYRGTVFMSWFPLGKLRGTQKLTDAAWYASAFSHEEKLVRNIAVEESLYQSLKKTKDVDTLAAALDNPSLKFYRPLVSARLAAVLAGQSRSQRLKHYAAIVEKHPDFTGDIHGNERLFFMGPADLRVMDVLKETYRKRSAPAMAASIKAAGKPYAVFTPEESSWLVKEGLPVDVVAAMISASEPKSAPETVPVGLLAGAAPGDQAAGLPVASNALEATAAECSKAYAAKKVCENMPGDPFGLLTRGCMAQVKKKFGGSGCSIF